LEQELLILMMFSWWWGDAPQKIPRLRRFKSDRNEIWQDSSSSTWLSRCMTAMTSAG